MPTVAPPSSPVAFRSPSPDGGESSTENDGAESVTDTAISTDSVHQIHTPSLSPSPSPLPPSFPLFSVNFQSEGTHESHHDSAQGSVAGGEVYHYSTGKSREQIEFEQGRIDYTGRHRFEFIQEALDSQLNDTDSSSV